MHVSTLPQTPLPSRLPCNIEQSSMCYTVRPCWLSALNTAVCTCPFQTLHVFPPSFPQTTKNSSLSLFTIAKTWQQPKCPLTEEWIRKMWYIYAMEYYPAIKKNEIMPWMDQEIVILSEVNQTEKEIIFLFFGYISGSEIVGSAESLSHVCDPVDCGSPASSVQGISQARILKWVAILFSRGSSQPKDQT